MKPEDNKNLQQVDSLLFEAARKLEQMADNARVDNNKDFHESLFAQLKSSVDNVRKSILKLYADE